LIEPRIKLEKEADSNAFMPGGEVCQELVQELIVTPELILTVMAPLEAALLNWYKVQAAETLKGRLSKEDFQVGWVCPRIRHDRQQISNLHTKMLQGFSMF
jgi:hypothetical protein